MKKYIAYYLFFIFGVILLVYRNWVFSPEIIGGDWPYYYPEFLSNFSLIPTIWTGWQGNGLGGVQTFLGLHFFSSLLIVIFHQWFHLPWPVVYKAGWFFASIFFSCISIAVLIREIWKPVPMWVMMIGSLIYSTNTYILMLTAGGQMGVALAYSITPFIFLSYIRLTDQKKAKNFQMEMSTNFSKIVTAGMLLSLQLAIDPRIAYVSIVAVTIYFFCMGCVSGIQISLQILIRGGLSFVVALLVSMFWLLPTVVVKDTVIRSMDAIYTSVDALRFFSFADFSHALSLLHPNWPENVFGKTSFLQPEFLIFPFVSFASLFLVRQVNLEKRRAMVALVFVGLAGVFLAKGSNEPFSWIYPWLFVHLPGFILFRDSTKFYVIVALTYAVLIPVVLYQLEQWLRQQKIGGCLRALYLFPSIGFILLWFLAIRPSWQGQLGGTFVRQTVPEAYVRLHGLLAEDTSFFRTLWIPRLQRFGFSTIDHMAVESEPLFHASNSAEFAIALSQSGIEEKISALGIQYFIVPEDPSGDIFKTDRKFDPSKRMAYENVLASISWLDKVQKGSLSIYKTKVSPRDRFWLEADGALTYVVHSQVSNTVNIKTTRPTTLHFSQSFHPGWKAETQGKELVGKADVYGLMSFTLEDSGDYDVHVYFSPQKYVVYGFWISFLTIGIFISIRMLLQKKS